MSGFVREHSWPVAVSVLLHGLLALGLVLVAFITNRREAPGLQPLPIDAVVVDAQALHAAQKINTDRAEQEVARVTAEEADRVAAAAAQAAAESHIDDQAQAAAATADQAAAAPTAEAEPMAEDSATDATNAANAAAVEQQQLDSQKAAQAQTAAEAQHRAAAAKTAAAKAAAVAEESQRAAQAAAAKKMQEAKRAAEAKEALEAKQAAEAKKAADDRARQDREAKQEREAKRDREAELRRQLADEEHRSAVRSGPLRDQYIAALQNRIQRAWIKPPSANAGVDCTVEVTQVPGGAVTGARVTQCNGDAAVRQSIENAVYRASPLPDPADLALFERNFVFRFRPNE